jgi:arylsulfatase A-like enzyme
MHKLYRDPPIDFPQPTEPDGFASLEAHSEVRRNYAAMLEHLDECLGQLIAGVEARGELYNTLDRIWKRPRRDVG